MEDVEAGTDENSKGNEITDSYYIKLVLSDDDKTTVEKPTVGCFTQCVFNDSSDSSNDMNGVTSIENTKDYERKPFILKPF